MRSVIFMYIYYLYFFQLKFFLFKKFLCNVYYTAFHVGNSPLLCWLIFTSTQYSHKPQVNEANRIEFWRGKNYQLTPDLNTLVISSRFSYLYEYAPSP